MKTEHKDMCAQKKNDNGQESMEWVSRDGRRKSIVGRISEKRSVLSQEWESEGVMGGDNGLYTI